MTAAVLFVIRPVDAMTETISTRGRSLSALKSSHPREVVEGQVKSLPQREEALGGPFDVLGRGDAPGLGALNVLERVVVGAGLEADLIRRSSRPG